MADRYLLIGVAAKVLVVEVTPAALPAPTGLTAWPTRAAPTSPLLGWTPADGGAATGYKVERAPDAGGAPGAWLQVGTAPAGSVSYTDPALACYTPYWYRVRATSLLADGPYTPAVRVWTSGILRALYNVAGTDLGTSSGAGNFSAPMTPTPAMMRAAGINAMTSGFFYNPAITGQPDFPSWQAGFDAAGGFPHYRDPIIHPVDGGAPFYWLATGDDLCRTQQLINGSTGGYGPQAVAYAAAALAAVTFASGEPACLHVEMTDEANSVIPPAKPNPPQQGIYDITANVKSAAPRLRLGWPCDGGPGTSTNAAALRPWQTAPLAHFGDIYSPANIWYAPDLAGAQFSAQRGIQSFTAQKAIMDQIPAGMVSGLIGVGGDYGVGDGSGGFTVQQGLWRPEVALGTIWVSLAYGTTVLRYYSWDSVGAWNTRHPPPALNVAYQTGCTPQVEPSKWAVLTGSNNFIARVEEALCGTAQAAPAWGANFITAARAATSGKKALWGVNVTNAAQTVPGPAPAGYANATKLTIDGATADMSPSALAGATLQGGEVAVFWQ